MKKIEFIDFARGFSIFTIVAYHFLYKLHYPKYVIYATQFGGAGVHLFFFVSGFGLTLSKYIDYKTFIKRRLSKVLTPYFIAITCIFCINLFSKVYPVNIWAYLSHILLFKMFVPRFEVSYGIQFWFMSTIIQFYIVFPLLLLLLKYEKYKLFLIITLIASLTYSLLVSLSPYASERIFNGFFIQYLWEFALGMVIARTGTLDKLINRQLSHYFIIAPVCIAITSLLAIKGGTIGKNFNDIFSFFAYSAVVVIIFRTIPPLNKFFIWISGFSFSLYLMHMLLWDYVKKYYGLTFFTPINLILIFVVTIFYSYVYNILVEKITATRQKKLPAI